MVDGTSFELGFSYEPFNRDFVRSARTLEAASGVVMDEQ